MGIRMLNDIKIEVDGDSDWNESIQDFTGDVSMSFSDSAQHDKIEINIKHGNNCAISLGELQAIVRKFEDKTK